MTPVVYLHGFASGPGSGKAQFFGRRLTERGVEVRIPQLDENDFETLTITRQLSVIERAVAGGPAVLMGSSLGGYLAALYASTHPEIKRLVLMAPAFRFPSRWRERHAPDLERWEREGTLPFFHYSHKADRPLGYSFVEDARPYPDEPVFPQPALILHGRLDPVVPAEISGEYVARHPNATLRLFDSGHELSDVMEPMWAETARFLGLA
jgi:pimeloyl-ACP methyl ester carboxylesterase